MNHPLPNPRSTLHALAPIGLGTPHVESLLSYFCRLVVSHSVSVAALSRQVAKTVGWELSDKFDWHASQVSGIGEAANNWSAALSALTSVERLDRLTLLSWRHVTAQSNLAAACSRWCPQCLAEDLETGKTPYFRLAWDVKAVTVCSKHKTQLVHVCPDCGRTNARHNSAYVVPGWCAHCGGFLGNVIHLVPARPEEIWKASQVGSVLQAQPTLASAPTRELLHETIGDLVTRLDNGKGALFARRIGLSKGTVHHWLKDGGIPTLPAHLRIASQAGVALPALLTGNLKEWQPDSGEIYQLALLFPDQTRRTVPHAVDWERIRGELVALSKLPSIVSVSEAARRLDIDARQLYRNANKEARVLSERWKHYMQRRGEQNLANARVAIEAACREMLTEGIAINLRELETRVPKEILGRVRGVIDLLQDAKEKLGVS